jgi:hypothetical protein
MKTLLLCALLVIVKLCDAGQIDTITDGNSLLRAVRLVNRVENRAELTNEEQAFASFTFGYFEGFLSSSFLWEKLDRACPFRLPERISVGQLVEVVDKYLSNHPEMLHEPASGLVLVALLDSFRNPSQPKPNLSPKP